MLMNCYHQMCVRTTFRVIYQQDVYGSTLVESKLWDQDEGTSLLETIPFFWLDITAE